MIRNVVAALALSASFLAMVDVTVRNVDRRPKPPAMTLTAVGSARVVVLMGDSTRRLLGYTVRLDEADSRLLASGQESVIRTADIPLPASSCITPVTVRVESQSLARSVSLSLAPSGPGQAGCLLHPTGSRPGRRVAAATGSRTSPRRKKLVRHRARAKRHVGR